MVIRKRATPTKKNAHLLHILIIGVGNMGASLARGLLASPLGHNLSLKLYDLHNERCDNLANDSRVVRLKTLDNLKSFGEDAVILCTKPQDMHVVAKSLAGKLGSQTLLVSILAAITTDDLSKAFKFKGAVVRAMPNIAATVGEAATAMTRNSACDAEHQALAHEIFTSVGTASWTKESLMDAVTGLSGSGPAYIYMVIEALTDGGVKMGLPRALASELATQTVLGSASLVRSAGVHPAILRDQVTTPGGTTITAIHELEERGLRAMLMSAVTTATERSEVLRKAANTSGT